MHYFCESSDILRELFSDNVERSIDCIFVYFFFANGVIRLPSLKLYLESVDLGFRLAKNMQV